MLSSFDIWFRTIQVTCLRVWLFIDIQAGKLALIFPSVLDEGRLIDKETFVFYKIFRWNLLDKENYPLYHT